MERLKRRRDFLATAKGRKAPRRAFVLEARGRDDDNPPRVGFTVSKRVAKSAVERNRIRRRLKEIVRRAGNGGVCAGFDYVVVGRRAALGESFADMTAALQDALTEVRGFSGKSAASDSRIGQ
jgi:ribonuclease P protein component